MCFACPNQVWVHLRVIGVWVQWWCSGVLFSFLLCCACPHHVWVHPASFPRRPWGVQICVCCIGVYCISDWHGSGPINDKFKIVLLHANVLHPNSCCTRLGCGALHNLVVWHVLRRGICSVCTIRRKMVAIDVGICTPVCPISLRFFWRKSCFDSESFLFLLSLLLLLCDNNKTLTQQQLRP